MQLLCVSLFAGRMVERQEPRQYETGYQALGSFYDDEHEDAPPAENIVHIVPDKNKCKFSLKEFIHTPRNCHFSSSQYIVFKFPRYYMMKLSQQYIDKRLLCVDLCENKFTIL